MILVGAAAFICDYAIQNQGRCVMLVLQVFIYLQVLDFLTTLVGFKLGASEASPFIAKLIHLSSPAIGLGLSKIAGIVIGGLCVRHPAGEDCRLDQLLVRRSRGVEPLRDSGCRHPPHALTRANHPLPRID